MFKNHIDTCKEACLQEIRTSKNKRLKKLMKEVEKELPVDYKEEGISSFMSEILDTAIKNDLHDEEESYVIEVLQNYLDHIKKMKTFYVFDVSLIGLQSELHRTIKISSLMKLADLGYMILAAFKAEGSHLFNFQIKEERYACDTELDLDDFDEYIILASECTLADLPLRKNTKFSFTYDYGDNYDFTITLKDMVVEEDMLTALSDYVLDGNGYGIWEDAHYELDLFYSDRSKFDEFLKENDIDVEYYPIDKVFDIEACNKDVALNLYAIKMAYELDDDDIEDEFETMLM